jgi:hypothetical protein
MESRIKKLLASPAEIYKDSIKIGFFCEKTSFKTLRKASSNYP